MSLLAEQLVQEWMHRQGFFTIRGARDGVDEIDLLGVRPIGDEIEGWHVEVQVSFKPIAYLTPLTDDLANSLRKKRTSAWTRPPDKAATCVDAWIARKFLHKHKRAVREKLWPGAEWKNILVHGVIRHPDEEAELSRRLVMVPFFHVLRDVCYRKHDGYPGAAGADIAEIVAYFERQQASIFKHDVQP